MLLAGATWAVLVLLYAAKCLLARDEAAAELRHPVQCCFIGLIGVATSLMAVAAFPYSVAAAGVLFIAGASFTLGFAVWRTGLLWQGERDLTATTPVLYLPTVAGAFATAIAAGPLGYGDIGRFAFGAGLCSWLAIESVLLHRLYTGPAMPPSLRPALGIQLAPPTVGAMAYLTVSGGAPDMVAHALVGYGLLQALVLIRMLPWIMEQPFTPAYWGFTFGASALATAPLWIVEAGETGTIAELAPYLFMAANLTVGLVVLGTLGLGARRWTKQRADAPQT
jgi:tellurite resistance protein